jgi:uncharacterized membrane protein YkoI
MNTRNIMSTRNKSFTLGLVSAGLLFSAMAFADDDAKRLPETKISLTEAIAIAEKNQNGRAYEASLDDDGPALKYEIGVLVGEKTFEVDVDATTGELGKVREDRD